MLNAYLAGKKLLRGDYTQYTPTGKSLFVKQGAYHKEPQVGDIVYFFSQSKGRVAHVGAVIEVIKSNDIYRIKTIEGNTSSGSGFNRNGGEVAEKYYSFKLNEVGGTNRINGFGTPSFGMETCLTSHFINILKGEVGYLEKASNRDLDYKDKNVGNKNFTKYGQFFEDNKLGGNGLYWCQQFISWCAYKACTLIRKDLKTGWELVENVWKYRQNGNLLKDQWAEIGGRWYAFNGAGEMITGWFKSQDEWYYLNSADGAMLSSQWLTLDGRDYYLTNSGAMAKSCYVKGVNNIYHWIDNEGHYDPTQDTREPDLQKYEVAS